MKTLSETWFAEGYIDFELKKYTLLAYLQEVNKCFNQQKLYPHLADVIFHYNNLLSLRENKKFLQEHFPKKLTGIQMEKLQLLYEQLEEDDDLMKELEDIIVYASIKLKKSICSATEIYEFVETNINIEPIGIVPLELNEGYFFLNEAAVNCTKVYHYRISIFEKHDERYRSIKTVFVDEWHRNLVNTYGNIKAELIKTHKHLPNPAVYAIETSIQYPLEETILPIAKRSLVRYISHHAA